MSIKLKDNEEIFHEAKIHWSSYIWPSLWAILFTPSIIGALISETNNKIGSSIGLLIVGALPLLVVWLKNKAKKYVVTNQRLYVQEGILITTKKDIPLNKINDIEAVQDIFQRILKSGGVRVMTGNDNSTVMKNIENHEELKEKLTEAVSKFKQNKVA